MNFVFKSKKEAFADGRANSKFSFFKNATPEKSVTQGFTRSEAPSTGSGVGFVGIWKLEPMKLCAHHNVFEHRFPSWKYWLFHYLSSHRLNMFQCALVPLSSKYFSILDLLTVYSMKNFQATFPCKACGRREIQARPSTFMKIWSHFDLSPNWNEKKSYSKSWLREDSFNATRCLRSTSCDWGRNLIKTPSLADSLNVRAHIQHFGPTI